MEGLGVLLINSNTLCHLCVCVCVVLFMDINPSLFPSPSIQPLAWLCLFEDSLNPKTSSLHPRSLRLQGS